jgi:hypothetical protein
MSNLIALKELIEIERLQRSGAHALLIAAFYLSYKPFVLLSIAVNLLCFWHLESIASN